MVQPRDHLPFSFHMVCENHMVVFMVIPSSCVLTWLRGHGLPPFLSMSLASWSPSHVLTFPISLNSESLKPLGTDLRTLRASLNPIVMSPAWPQAPSPCGRLPCSYLHPDISSEPFLPVVFSQVTKKQFHALFLDTWSHSWFLYFSSLLLSIMSRCFSSYNVSIVSLPLCHLLPNCHFSLVVTIVY